VTHEELQKIARQQPFEPFRLILTTGATFDVRHPDLIMVGRRSATIGLTNKPNRTIYDYTVTVDLLHIVAIEKLPGSPPASNGVSS
jgi:hypothetical protein